MGKGYRITLIANWNYDTVIMDFSEEKLEFHNLLKEYLLTIDQFCIYCWFSVDKMREEFKKLLYPVVRQSYNFYISDKWLEGMPDYINNVLSEYIPVNLESWDYCSSFESIEIIEFRK